MWLRARLLDCPELYAACLNIVSSEIFLSRAALNTFPNLLPLRSGLPFLDNISAYKTYTMLYAGCEA